MYFSSLTKTIFSSIQELDFLKGKTEFELLDWRSVLKGVKLNINPRVRLGISESC